jgi:phenylpropionate dioxygenase-like ring-hydroxylating dioxygenase large terminal subunit
MINKRRDAGTSGVKMSAGSGVDIETLILSDRVHKSVYTDPSIFDLEMRNIFGRTWIYVGHESQVPKPGDYWTATLGKQPVIMVRDRQGSVHVLYNRCPHKGAKVVADGCGSTGPIFRCPYHAWTFRHDGSLLGVPYRKAYAGTAFDIKDPLFSVRKVARVDSYRGFVFACLAADGPELTTFLGGIITSLDNFCDRSPTGEVEVAGGVFRVMQKSNWKIFLENLNDTGHPRATHESSYVAARKIVRERLGGKTPFELHIIEGNGEPGEFWESLELRAFDYGHSFMGAIFNAPTDDVSLSYMKSLEQAYGKDRAFEILSMNRHNTIIYPSCSPHTSFQQLRVIRPVSVDRTLVEIFTFRLKGAPEEFWRRTLVYTNVVNSPSSIVMADDVDVYNRCQMGMQSDGGDWISQHRRAGYEQLEDDSTVADGISEMPIRNQFKAWKAFMSGSL